MPRIIRADDSFDPRWLHPRLWGAWLACCLIGLLGCLPWFIQKQLGAWLGWLAFSLIKQRVADTRVNLALCFPIKSETEREAMVRDVFRNAGIGIFEAANAWFKPLRWQLRRVRTEGIEHVIEAAKLGRGVIILGAHYSGLELNGAMASQFFPLHVIYRPQNNPVLDWFIRTRRRRTYINQIDHADMRTLFKSLRRGDIVWTSVDQDFGLKQGVMAPFFGVPAATLTATSRMARINNSPVLFTQFFRTADDNYTLRFTHPLMDYPSGNDEMDAERMNAMLANMIGEHPTQYMWFHRRFKSRPDGQSFLYARKRKHRK